MHLYKLTLVTILQRKVWLIAFLCAGVLPLILPYLTPYESNPTLIQPARAQAAWVGLWVISMLWVFFQAARFGDDNARSGMGSYFLSRGVSNMSQLFQIWLACMTFLIPLVVIAVAVCWFGAMPGDPDQAHAWILLNWQYAGVFLIAIAPLMILGVALGSRVGGTVGFLVPLSLLLYGLYGVGYVEMVADSKDIPVLDWLFVASPHYHIADLTERFVFKLGAMVGSEWLLNASYLTGVGLVLVAISMLSFRSKSIA
jgi:hypothetical protein